MNEKAIPVPSVASENPSCSVPDQQNGFGSRWSQNLGMGLIVLGFAITPILFGDSKPCPICNVKHVSDAQSDKALPADTLLAEPATESGESAKTESDFVDRR